MQIPELFIHAIIQHQTWDGGIDEANIVATGTRGVKT